ncbi:NACHT domain-containing protein [Streptomyces sp. SAI-129]|uniref:NACHT domain-containing protein n=1 Tax=Streptomyces sp. SAI-129 TaxID=3377727 RepID=UPI003C79776A
MVGLWGRAGLYVVSAAALGWLALVVIREGWSAADPVASVIGATAGVGALLMARWSASGHDPEAVAERLAQHVTRVEAQRYAQLFGGNLGGRIDVAFRAEAYGELEGAATTGSLTDILGFYGDLRPGRVVITDSARLMDGTDGAGSGKTLAALTLLLGLVEERGTGSPVPLWLTAASWPGGSVENWLSTELTQVWRVPRRAAERLIEARLVLPVIDGLDEVDGTFAPGYGSRAADLLRTVNAYQQTLHLAPMILTCRGRAYEALVDAEVHLRNAVVLQLQPVTASQARRYLEHHVADSRTSRDRWQAVLDALEPPPPADGHPADRDGGRPAGWPPRTTRQVPAPRRLWASLVRRLPAPANEPTEPLAQPSRPPSSTTAVPHPLQCALDTPWRLTLAATVYQERDPRGGYRRHPDTLLGLARDDTLREYLLDRYIPALLATDPAGSRRRVLKPHRAWRQLAVLARYLNDNVGRPPVAGRLVSSTDLILEELWLLAGPRARALHVLLALVFAAIGTVVAVLPSLHAGLSLNTMFMAAMFYSPVGFALPKWQVPVRLSLRSVLTWRGVAWTLLGLTSGLLSVGDTSDPLRAAAGVGGGTLAGMVAGLTTLGPRPSGDPRQPMRDIVAAMLVTVLVLGPVLGVSDWSTSNESFGLTVAAWSALGPFIAVNVGLITPAGRYFTLLLSTRGQLPWRLSRFLRACYEAQLLRTAGLAYQFRHRELQEHLARHPQLPQQN